MHRNADWHEFRSRIERAIASEIKSYGKVINAERWLVDGIEGKCADAVMTTIDTTSEAAEWGAREISEAPTDA